MVFSALSLLAQQNGVKRSYHGASLDMSRVACLILGGGEGTRLHPLTSTRCKPAISFGGRYKLIDVPISNALNSKCNSIFIITQYLSSSLHRHIFQTYHPNTLSTGFIDILTAEKKPNARSWYQGTADAVRQNTEHLLSTTADYFLILSGDQLYNIDFKDMLHFAMQRDADLVVASLPIAVSDAKRMGVLKIDQNAMITDFVEKPNQAEVIEGFQFDEHFKSTHGLETTKSLLGSMGIYLFKRQTLFSLLQEDSREDFGKHLIPSQIKKGKTFAYLHKGYWEDIGTVETFYHANIQMTHSNSPFNFYNEISPLFSHRYHLPGPKIIDTHISNSILCEGSIIAADEISHSIVGPRSIVQKGTIIKDSYLMGNDFYHHPHDPKSNYSIGENCLIKKTIIDNQVSIGNGVQLINKNQLNSYDSENICIRDGIIIVMRGADIPDGFIL